MSKYKDIPMIMNLNLKISPQKFPLKSFFIPHKNKIKKIGETIKNNKNRIFI